MHEQGHWFPLNDFFEFGWHSTNFESLCATWISTRRSAANVVENAKPMRMACMICFVDDMKVNALKARRQSNSSAKRIMSVTWRNVRAELTRNREK